MKENYFYTLEEIENEFIGAKGTTERDKYEADLNNCLSSLKGLQYTA